MKNLAETILISIQFTTQKIIEKKSMNHVVGVDNLIEYRKKLIYEYIQIFGTTDNFKSEKFAADNSYKRISSSISKL